jgi:hypothetical protein
VASKARLRTVCAALGAAAALSGLPASDGLARAVGVSIRVAPTVVRYPASVRVSGRVSGVADPFGLKVELRWDAHPFAGFEAVKEGTTGQDGSFAFDVVPTRNTRYQVVVAGAAPVTTSTVATVQQPVATERRCNYCGGSLPARSFVVRQRGTLRFPPGAVVPARSRTLYVYAGFNLSFRGGAPAPRSRLRLLGARGSLVPRGGGRYVWSLAFRAPAGTRSFWFDHCYRDPPGFGPLNGRHTCGVLRSIRVPAPYLG